MGHTFCSRYSRRRFRPPCLPARAWRRARRSTSAWRIACVLVSRARLATSSANLSTSIFLMFSAMAEYLLYSTIPPKTTSGLPAGCLNKLGNPVPGDRSPEKPAPQASAFAASSPRAGFSGERIPRLIREIPKTCTHPSGWERTGSAGFRPRSAALTRRSQGRTRQFERTVEPALECHIAVVVAAQDWSKEVGRGESDAPSVGCADLPQHGSVIEVHLLADQAVAFEHENARGLNFHPVSAGGDAGPRSAVRAAEAAFHDHGVVGMMH